MTNKKKQCSLPDYHGLKWLDDSLPIALPETTRDWLDCSKHGLRQRKTSGLKSRSTVKSLLQSHDWQWPHRSTVFISDLHADGDALLASLVASGGIKKTGKDDYHFKLTEQGRSMLFIFGGDFFDKGPSNLRLLRVLHMFIKTGARVRLLAGNHDIRVLFGMRSVGQTEDPHNGHFFIRMGAKAIPFLLEIRDEYLSDNNALKAMPDEETCIKRLFPTEAWWQQFPEMASWVMPPESISREMAKIKHKAERFEMLCEQAGLSLREAYAAAVKWQQLFLSQEGEFYWFFKRMRLAYRKGSFLFVHAGIDDRIAVMLRDNNTGFLNQQFKQQIQGSPFEFYYGPVANTIRTKYRTIDMPLSGIGAKQVRDAGIHAIVHGHRNLHRGQRIALRKKLLHFECDVTLDRHSRRKEGLRGAGAGVTLVQPSGYILGISTDYRDIKVFHPESILADAGDFHATK
ncbi:metallophosphoesterase [Mariprofundus sp. EBB-1]|uniref:metallophosphoesterase n=1 Tax=Mariprofundus sp. EBB-1 TaxID=2650971 RepID=UPI001379E1D4|nr:metallophosphoesterase [Mariprofundus sp. EBB-1]